MRPIRSTALLTLLLGCLLSLLLNPLVASATLVRVPDGSPEATMTRGSVLTSLLTSDARGRADALMSTVDSRLGWSDANTFVVGTNPITTFKPQSFVYKLPHNDFKVTGAVLWGRVYAQINRASPRDEASLSRTDGNNYAAFSGIEWRDEGGVLGAHLSYQHNKTQFISTPEEDGNLRTRLFAFYPYIFLGLGKDASLWGLGGYGTGRMAYRSGRLLNFVPSTDLKQILYAGGLRIPMRVDLGSKAILKGGYVKTRLRSDAVQVGETLFVPRLQSDYQQIRAAIDVGFYFGSDERTFWSAQMDFGGRHERGTTHQSGFGADLLVALAYQDLDRGFSVQFYLQAVYMFNRERYTGLGGGAMLSYKGSSSNGRGLTLSLRPTFGHFGQRLQDFTVASSPLHETNTVLGAPDDLRNSLNALQVAGLHFDMVWRY